MGLSPLIVMSPRHRSGTSVGGEARVNQHAAATVRKRLESLFHLWAMFTLRSKPEHLEAARFKATTSGRWLSWAPGDGNNKYRPWMQFVINWSTSFALWFTEGRKMRKTIRLSLHRPEYSMRSNVFSGKGAEGSTGSSIRLAKLRRAQALVSQISVQFGEIVLIFFCNF